MLLKQVKYSERGYQRIYSYSLESTCEIDDKIAIIIQGPIQEKFNFLKNTLEIYKKIFKNSIIIISTWKNENVEKINTLKDQNIHILYNDEPEKSKSNINHQIHSLIAYPLPSRTKQQQHYQHGNYLL